MKSAPRRVEAHELTASWPIPSAARLGSSVRSKGIYLEIRERLPHTARKSLSVKGGEITLTMPKGAEAEFSRASLMVVRALDGIESRPVIPREIEDILGITATERRRWLDDGRLPSAGTRTVSLRGRASKITFHVFDPLVVADILERDAVDGWREEDAERAAEKRRQAAWNRRLTRATTAGARDTPTADAAADDQSRFKLKGWAEFEREGLLR